MSTLKQLNEALGQDKLTVLAVAVDQMRDSLMERGEALSLDDQIETLSLDELAEEHGMTPKALRDKISSKIGSSVVIRLGKRHVIRKTRYLEFLRACESEAD